MKERLHGPEAERGETGRRPPDIAEADLAQDTVSAPVPAAVTWARTQLREQIQRAWLRRAPTTEAACKQGREPERAPLADREPEP